MYKVKVSKTLKNKYYFWYIYRCLYTLRDRKEIELEEIDNPYFEEDYYELIYVNDYPIFIDVRDDFGISKNLDNYIKDYILLKSNFSSELWNKAPENFEYKLKDFELKIRPKIKPFIHGRGIKLPYTTNELTYFKSSVKSNYKIVSFTGTGLFNRQTESRLKVYDLFDKVFKNKAKLMFMDKKHLVKPNKKQIENYDYYLQKYKSNIKVGGIEQYMEFISSGEFSINVPGLCLSTPFRFVDSIIANRCIISTRIYHDIYEMFPCVKLPICGYFGDGDWQMAETILSGIDSVNKREMLKKTKDWYSWYLSVYGMWRNQILKAVKDKIK